VPERKLGELGSTPLFSKYRWGHSGFTGGHGLLVPLGYSPVAQVRRTVDKTSYDAPIAATICGPPGSVNVTRPVV